MSLRSKVKKFFGGGSDPAEKVAELAKGMSLSTKVETGEPEKRWCTKGKERPRSKARIKRKRLRQLARAARRVNRKNAA